MAGGLLVLARGFIGKALQIALLSISPAALFPQQFLQTIEVEDTSAVRRYAPKLYIDCSRCYISYLKSEITFVNYVRDRMEADIHLIITTETTSGGGTEYTLEFIGCGDYSDIGFTLKYACDATATEDERREGLARTIKMGLMPFVERTPVRDYIRINYISEEKSEEVVDKWKNWVFKLGLNGYARGESQSSYYSLNGSMSIKKITEDDKIKFFGYTNYTESRYDIEGDIVKSITRNHGASARFVKGLGEHFAAMVRAGYWQSRYENIKLGLSVSAGVEYNVFPYSEYSQHEFLFIYTITTSYNDYYEETIYEKLSEVVFSEGLTCRLSMIRKWGSVGISLHGSHYFHDLSLNNIGVNLDASVRVIGGLSSNLWCGVSMIHDQISLRREGATVEEILLQQQQLQTQYSYRISIGLSYTFGSIYTNIVNPRF